MRKCLCVSLILLPLHIQPQLLSLLENMSPEEQDRVRIIVWNGNVPQSENKALQLAVSPSSSPVLADAVVRCLPLSSFFFPFQLPLPF